MRASLPAIGACCGRLGALGLEGSPLDGAGLTCTQGSYLPHDLVRILKSLMEEGGRAPAEEEDDDEQAAGGNL